MCNQLWRAAQLAPDCSSSSSSVRVQRPRLQDSPAQAARKAAGTPTRRETYTPPPVFFLTEEADILAGENPDNVVLLIALYADGTVIEVWVCFLKRKAQEPVTRGSEQCTNEEKQFRQNLPVATRGNE